MKLLGFHPIPCLSLIALIAAAPHARAQTDEPSLPTPAGVSTPATTITPVAATVPHPPGYGARAYGAPAYDTLVLNGAGVNTLTEPVLVVPAKPMDPKALDQVIEDLSIMARIIEKNALGGDQAGAVSSFTFANGLALSSSWGPNAGGPGLVFAGTGRPKAMYLGGYGAVFFMRVAYPLLPPPQAAEEQRADSQGDPVWAEAKRSVLEGEPPLGLAQEGAEPEVSYSPEQVETLKSALIATMKHAGNVRGLEPTEWVAMVVQGPTPTTDPSSQDARYGAPPITGAGRTVLTLRATRGDIDQYAKGQLSQQQFEQRLQVISY